MTLRIEHDTGRLDLLVNYPHLVDFLERHQELQDIELGFQFGKLMPIDVVLQGSTVAV